jgi:putative DNA-invertase from lambdoid prophage Rac
MQMAVRDALISFMAALSQAQAEATKEAQRAGIEHAKAREDTYRGRKPSFTREQLDHVRDMLTTGTSITTIAKTTGLSRQAIYRLKDDPAWAEGVLVTWAAQWCAPRGSGRAFGGIHRLNTLNKGPQGRDVQSGRQRIRTGSA